MEQTTALEQPVIDADSGYNAKKTYALYVNPANRHISGMIGFIVPIDDVTDSRNYLHVNIMDLTEDEYVDISRSLNNTDSMTFLGEDNRTIITRRIYIDMLDGTFFDQKAGMMYAVNNEVKLRVRCVDNTLTDADDVKVVEVKNVKKADNPISINGADPSTIKVYLDNPSEVSLKLLGTGVHAVKVKAKLPNVEYLWLTAYPQLAHLDAQQLADLDKWIAENPQP